jgi:translation initiation factor eIF-2B subunit delta
MRTSSNPTSPTVLSAPAAMDALASAAPTSSSQTQQQQQQQQQKHEVSPRRTSSAQDAAAGGSITAPTARSTPPKPPPSSSSRSAAATAETGGSKGDQQQQGQQQQGRPQQKEMTKAERRALQEAQRAAKAAGGSKGGASVGGSKAQLQKTDSSGSLSRQSTLDGRGGGGDGRTSSRQQKKDTAGDASAAIGATPSSTHGGSHSATAKGAAAAGSSSPSIKPSACIELFAHLPQFKAVTVESVADRAATANVPIECVRLGIQMAEGSIRGANARCAAMLDMFTAAIQSFKTPNGKIFAREFGSALNAMVAFLVSCRPLSPAMGNVIKAVKAELGRIGANPMINDGDANTKLLSFVATFSQEKVQFARETLARQAAARIAEGDVILTYARSSTVEAVLLAAAEAGTRFSVVVVDSRPLLEGRALLTRLLKAGITCEYVLINGMMSALSNATKVMLGAGAVFSNGAVLSRVGTAVVAMSANAAHVPVMVCSETYKFHDRVQLDSVTYNELGDPAALTKLNDHGGGAVVADSTGINGTATSSSSNPNLSLLNLEYDTTPAEFVTVVVTEVGVLPPTSVPVVLREYRTDEMV